MTSSRVAMDAADTLQTLYVGRPTAPRVQEGVVAPAVPALVVDEPVGERLLRDGAVLRLPSADAER